MNNWQTFWQAKLKNWQFFGTVAPQVEQLAQLWHSGMFIGKLARKNETCI